MPLNTSAISSFAAVVALALGLVVGGAVHATEVSEAFIIPLFPQKERDLMKGFPPGMTPYSFWAARGTAKLTKRAATPKPPMSSSEWPNSCKRRL